MVANTDRPHAVADELESGPWVRKDWSMTREMSSPRRDSQIRRAPNAAGLYDVLDLILDKGIVIDAFVRVSLVGIELLTVDLRVVIASVDTYLRYAEGVERLQVYDRSGSKRLPDVVGTGMKSHAASKGTEALEKGAQKVGRALTGRGGHDEGEHQGGDEHEGDEHPGGVVGAVSRGVRRVVGRLVGEEQDDQHGQGEAEERSQHRAQRLPSERASKHRPPPPARRPAENRR